MSGSREKSPVRNGREGETRPAGRCPFCEAEGVNPSPSGRHSVCRECGRITLHMRPRTRVRKEGMKP